MYLHIGNGVNIRTKDIIGIFDADRTTTSWITRKYLSDAQKREMVSAANEEIPKSFVLYRDTSCEDGTSKGQYKIYFSQLSTSALLGRLNSFGSEETAGTRS